MAEWLIATVLKIVMRVSASQVQILSYPPYADVMKLVNMLVSKTNGFVPYGFKSRRLHQICGCSSMVERRPSKSDVCEFKSRQSLHLLKNIVYEW